MFLCNKIDININNKININVKRGEMQIDPNCTCILPVFVFHTDISTSLLIYHYLFYCSYVHEFFLSSLLRFLLLFFFVSRFRFLDLDFFCLRRKLLFTVSPLQITVIKDSRFHTLRSLLFRPPPPSLVSFSSPIVPTYPSRSKYKAILGLVRCTRQGQTILISLNSSPHILHFRTFSTSSLYLIFPHSRHLIISLFVRRGF